MKIKMTGVTEKYKNKKAQVWIETVIYTLIAFVMIGLVLSYVKPKITEIQDRAVIEQSLEAIGSIEEVILSIKDVPGNKREVTLGVKKGSFIINGSADKIYFEIESGYEYSEKELPIQHGNTIILTKDIGENNRITLTNDYSEKYDIRYNYKQEIKKLDKSPTPYKIFISNKGEIDDKIVIDIESN